MKKQYLIIALLYLLLPPTGRGQIMYDGLYDPSSELLYSAVDNHSSNLLLEEKLIDEKIASTKSESVAYDKQAAVTSNANDFFRSNIISGNWNDVASWESSPDNSSWGPATLVPASTAQTITVRPGHIIIVNSAISLDETVIQGTLELQTGSVLNISDGIGVDIDVLNGGVINVKNSNDYTVMINQAVNASINVATNGRIIISGDGTTIGDNMHLFATNTSNIWNGGAVFEWNCSDGIPGTSGLMYFPNASAVTVPIFRITLVGGTLASGSNFILNGLLDLLTNVSFGGGGSKTFRDGISGNSAAVTFSNGTTTISSPTAILSGTLTMILNQTLNLTNGVTIPTSSTVTIDNASTNNIAKNGGVFNVQANAIFDIGYNSSMSNTNGSVDISGAFRTGNINGFTGTGSSLPSAAGVINLVAGCTVELNRNDGTSQILASRADFKNITFSGSGTKSFSSGFIPAGTVLIKDAAIVDAQNQSFGGAGTNLTMTGTSRFKTAGTGTKPNMQGTYTLGTGTTIEFTNVAATQQDIRLTGVDYYNIDISGSNVGNASPVTSLKMQEDATFKVKSGGTFKLANVDGFFGGANTALSNSNNFTITLEPNSTIDYNGSSGQMITGISPYQNLAISGSGTKTAPAEIPFFPLSILGNIVKTGSSIFDHNNATIKFSSTISPQSFINTGSTPFNFYNLINGNTESSSGLSIQNDLNIVNGLTLVTGSNLKLTAGSINLVSDNTKTAYVDKVVGSVLVSYDTGKFVVHRYLPIATTSAARRWRLLTAPLRTNNAPTINAAWQEGQSNPDRLTPLDTYPGFGTIITRSTTATNGYDQGSTGNPSIYKYTADNWTPLAATNSGAITDELGYMIFVRGNRNMVVSGPSVVGSPTTLRAKGEINIGTVSIPLDPAGFKLIGNPYASAISFNNVLVNGIDPSTTAGVTFYLWDPKFSGNYNVGGFVTCTSLGTGLYSVSVNGSGYVNGVYDGAIESGSAFMVPASSGNIVFDENCKLTSSSTLGIASRPVGHNGTNAGIDFFTGNLLSGKDSSLKVLDGVINIGSDDFDNAVNEKDAPKLISFQTAEKLSILRANKKISIELRKKLTDNDTIFYHLSKLNKGIYQFQFIKKSIDSTLAAILEDSFTGQQIVMPVNDSVNIPFSITADSASSAAERFRVVFKSSIKYNLLGAAVVKKDIEVKWQVDPEYNISHYEIERSLNGIAFNTLGSKQGIGNSNTILNYTWLDKTPGPGIYYYRIKAITANGAVTYSDIAKVKLIRSSSDLHVFPNPVTEKNIQLQLNDKPAGKYLIRLISNLGQTVTRGIINHSGGTATQIIKPASILQDGIYYLEVTSPDKKITNIKLVIKK